MPKLLSLIILLFLPISLSGCLVTEGRYLQKVSEADSLSQEQLFLKKRDNQLVAENSELKQSVDKSSLELAAALEEKSRLAELVSRHAAERENIEKDLKSSPSEALQRIAELRQQVAELEGREQKRKEAIIAIEQSSRTLQKMDESLVRSTCALYEQLLENMKSEISLGKVHLSELKGKISLVIPAPVLFASEEVELKSDGVALLSRLAATVKSFKGMQVTVEGHTGNQPARLPFTSRYPANWELSAIRAVNVVRQLQSQGVAPQALVAAAYGEYRPIAANEKKEGRENNGRIEIQLELSNL